ncbi:hypothetical protein OAR79_06250 [Candidatus Thioglobus sp.]|nr:hypothetical protein [Candidatus Thioglobus sp.]
MENDGSNFIILLVLAVVIGIVWNGAIKLFYKYNTLLVIAYIIILFPFALIHTIFLGLFGDTKKVMMKKKVQEQAKFEKLVEDEKETL